MRALLLILDGLGVGEAEDAGRFDSAGANTLGHLLTLEPGLSLPTLKGMGLEEVLEGEVFDPPGHDAALRQGAFGRMRPRGAGNDSLSGHWELAGATVTEPFATFDSFPEKLLKAIGNDAGVEFLGNQRMGAMEAMERYGAEHLETGRPIVFASASSALQLAAHEARMSPEALYDLARKARRRCDEWRIGRVIARPFAGEAGAWEELPQRHDLTMPPPRTVLNAIAEAGLQVEAVGKVAELFAYSGVTRSVPAATNEEALKAVERLWQDPHDGLVIANLCEFDLLYGHRRDPVGFARALEAFDRWLGGFLDRLEDDDLLVITSDHGNDPTFPGTDHTREDIPVLLHYDGRTGPLGVREGLVDVAATLGAFFALPEGSTPVGETLIPFHRRPPGFFVPM